MNSLEMNPPVTSGEWTFDPAATSIGFEANLIFGIKAKGRFSRYESDITVGVSGVGSSISFTVWIDSMTTGIKRRDQHLWADNVFAAVRFPTLEFHSTTVVDTPTGLDITGMLRIRDVSHSVAFHAVRSAESGPPRYTTEVVVSPKDYGITRPGTTKPLKVVIDATLKRR